jgi:hypothetical protein
VAQVALQRPGREREAVSYVGIRKQRSDLPNKATFCIYGELRRCVYHVDGSCDSPRINKGNSDARCHRLSNKALLKLLPVRTR